jgi:hypothetical protein
MFLDEKLYNRVKEQKFNSAEDAKQLVNDLYKICEDHYKPLIPIPGTPEASFKNVRSILDRTFTSWDLCVKKLEKEKYFFVDLLKGNKSYKEAFLAVPELKAIYDKGK